MPSDNNPPTALTRISKIKVVLDELRPGIEDHGGNIQLSTVENNMVFVTMSGSCSRCVMKATTISMIESKITDAFGERVTVYPVKN